jgi:hypothetical protein
MDLIEFEHTIQYLLRIHILSVWWCSFHSKYYAENRTIPEENPRIDEPYLRRMFPPSWLWCHLWPSPLWSFCPLYPQTQVGILEKLLQKGYLLHPAATCFLWYQNRRKSVLFCFQRPDNHMEKEMLLIISRNVWLFSVEMHDWLLSVEMYDFLVEMYECYQ